jgi:D-alanyl-D-alanine carboxypeptidase
MNVWPLQKDRDAFYGNPGATPAENAAWEAANLVDVLCPWKLFFIDGKIIQPVKAIRIHKKCADSLKTVLGNIWDAVNQDQSAIETLHYQHYSGSYVQRPMRGGTSRSCHGYGCAIDWDAEENMQHSMKHLFQPNSLLVVKFKEEGWTWGGDWSPASIDAMHVQAARVH